ncbi:peptidylprolyl isomerase [Croceibacterium sp. TMG7-5b_MA50]|uniref:peptidylprolyl isomerase n=1 Tax=Croceibacterium sp. TMG7-5b_MA50 TaxID=3121290 RepID=UPI003221AC2D
MGTIGRLQRRESWWNRVATPALAAALLSAPAIGQAQDQAPDPSTEEAADADAAGDALNIPADVQLMTRADPNKRRATARVNGTIITGTDVDQRVALILAANQSNQISPEEEQRLRLQVLRNLIDETLQIQEARLQEIEVTPEEVDQTYNQLATERFGRTIDGMTTYLTGIGSSPASLKRQIEGELAWDRLLRRNVEPFVNVSQEEVGERFTDLEARKGTDEYRIGEIFLAATSNNRTEKLQQAQQIMEQLRGGGSFIAYARQYSQASTAAVGGDLGWIQLAQLQNPQLEQAARDLAPGQLVGPVEIPGGFSILYLIDKRQIGMADPRDAVVSLKQIAIDFPAGTTEAQAQQKAAAFAQGVAAIRGCGEADAAAVQLGAEVVTNDEIVVRSLPEALQSAMLSLNVGETTPPFGSLEDGVRVLMLCGRDDPQVASGPSRDQLMRQMEDERVNRRAQRYLRDLRRDAVVEYN